MTFFGPSVVALTSDASIDFTPTNFDAPLAQDQQGYIKKQTGMSIPQVFWRKQIHGDDIILAKGDVRDCRSCPDADAFITNQQNLPVAIRTADCVPVFIYDPVAKVIGLAHAGWKGTHSHIAVKIAQRMVNEFGCQWYNIRIALGPAIRACCYQVGNEFREHFPEDVFERDGHLYVDIVAANRRQLIQTGVRPDNIYDSGVCTYCSSNYFSFRRDGAKSGRMISIMMLV